VARSCWGSAVISGDRGDPGIDFSFKPSWYFDDLHRPWGLRNIRDVNQERPRLIFLCFLMFSRQDDQCYLVLCDLYCFPEVLDRFLRSFLRRIKAKQHLNSIEMILFRFYYAFLLPTLIQQIGQLLLEISR